jgi:hypothetical protein
MLKTAAGGKQQVIVFVDVKLAAKTEAGAIDAINGVGGLMKNLTAERQFIRNLLLQDPAGEPVILIAKIIVLIDPVSAATVRRPIAEAFLHPYRQKHANVTCP